MTRDTLNKSTNVRGARRTVDKARRTVDNLLGIYSRFSRVGKVGLWIMLIFIIIAVAAPVIAPQDPARQNYDAFQQPPSVEHPMGTDHIGRDVLSRAIHGARVSMSVAGIAVGLAVIVGIPLGALSGFRGGLFDDIIMRIADSMMSIPGYILALALIAVVGRSLINVALVLAVVYAAQYARLVRSEVLSVKEETYIEAALGLGIPQKDILLREVLPNSIQPTLVQVSFHFGTAMLAEAALSYLGLGVQPPTPSWGGMIRDGESYLPEVWWAAVFPGIMIMLAVIAFNMVGDSIQDEYDPHGNMN